MKKKDWVFFTFFELIVLALGFCIGWLTLPETETTRVEEVMVPDYLSEWDMMQLAIIKTESEFDELAVGKSGDLGLYQITEVYVEEVNRILGEPIYAHTDAFDPWRAIQMFGIYQNYYNPDRDIYRAINLHNPNGDSIGYSVKVLRNLERIRKYEEVRRQIVEYEATKSL